MHPPPWKDCLEGMVLRDIQGWLWDLIHVRNAREGLKPASLDLRDTGRLLAPSSPYRTWHLLRHDPYTLKLVAMTTSLTFGISALTPSALSHSAHAFAAPVAMGAPPRRHLHTRTPPRPRLCRCRRRRRSSLRALEPVAVAAAAAAWRLTSSCCCPRSRSTSHASCR